MYAQIPFTSSLPTPARRCGGIRWLHARLALTERLLSADADEATKAKLDSAEYIFSSAMSAPLVVLSNAHSRLFTLDHHLSLIPYRFPPTSSDCCMTSVDHSALSHQGPARHSPLALRESEVDALGNKALSPNVSPSFDL